MSRSAFLVAAAGLAVALLTYLGCEQGEGDGERAMKLAGQRVLESGPMPPVTQGQITNWGLSDVARDGDRIALLATKTARGFTDTVNPFDPSDPTVYGSSTASGLPGTLALSDDLGRTWKRYEVPDTVFDVELHGGRIFLVSPLGFGSAQDNRLVLREFFPETGVIAPPAHEPVPYGLTLDAGREGRYATFVSGVLLPDTGFGHHRAVLSRLDLAHGPSVETTEFLLDLDQAWRFAPNVVRAGRAFISLERRYVTLDSWHPNEFVFPGYTEQICTVRGDVDAGPPVVERCDDVVDYPGNGHTESEARAITNQHGSVYELVRHGGHAFAVAVDGLTPPRRIYLGPDRPEIVSPLLLRLWTPQYDYFTLGDRVLWIDAHDQVHEMVVPLTNCIGGSYCEARRDERTLVTLLPLDGAPDTATEWLFFYRVMLDPLGRPRELGIYLDRVRATMRPFTATPPDLFTGPFPGCTTPPWAPTEIDVACARAINCSNGIGILRDCLRHLVATDHASRQRFIAESQQCVRGQGHLGTFPNYTTLPRVEPPADVCPPGETREGCHGDQLVQCYSGGPGRVTDCGALGLTCEDDVRDPTVDPASGDDMTHCTGNFGCEFGFGSHQTLYRGICQGDRLIFSALGGQRLVDCAALGMRCIPGRRKDDPRPQDLARLHAWCRSP